MYQKPKLEIIYLDVEWDVITTSPMTNKGTTTTDDWVITWPTQSNN